MRPSLHFLILAVHLVVTQASAQNLTRGTAPAKLRGTHEIVLTGDGGVANPFDTVATVTFLAPSRVPVPVKAFFDGGNSWRARVYVTEAGRWTWSSSGAPGSGLHGQHGVFAASASTLPGMLRTNSANGRMWMTDDGKTFLGIGDTAYLLFSQAQGEITTEAEFREFMREESQMGVTLLRCLALGSWTWGPYWEDGDESSGPRQRPHQLNFAQVDKRLEYVLNNYPGIQVQMILCPDGKTRADSTFWMSLTTGVRQKLMGYMVARWAAFPNVFWLTTNDTHVGFPLDYDGDRAEQNENATQAWNWADDVGEYFRVHDRWHHLMAFGHRRDVDYPFVSRDWNSYIPGYASYDLAADSLTWSNFGQYAPGNRYAGVANQHVYYMEDYYEGEQPFADANYFFRRHLWSWLLSGGSSTYGGKWKQVTPFSQTGHVGMNSFQYILPYFQNRGIDLAKFTFDDAIARQINAPAPEGNSGPSRPQAARRGNCEYIVYIPNAGDGELSGFKYNGTPAYEHSRRTAILNATKTPVVAVDLSHASGNFSVEWYRPTTGATRSGGSVAGSAWRRFTSPWQGVDAVLRILAETGPVK